MKNYLLKSMAVKMGWNKEKKTLRRHLKYLMQKNRTYSCIILFLLLSNIKSYGQYTYSDVQGIWGYVYTIPETDCPLAYYNRFLVFRNNYYIIVPTIYVECDILNSFGIFEYGFSNETLWYKVDSLHSCGKNLVFRDSNEQYDAWSFFEVTPKENMEFYNRGYIFLDKLPKKAQLVLYKRSHQDHRNYAREFLEYDICGIKADSVQLLDSLFNPTETVINQDDIVIVRETTGNLLQVEYEPEPNRYVVGYLRRKDLQFVESIEK